MTHPAPYALPTPRVHLNGTSKDELLRQNLDAMRAVEKARQAIATAAPHGRDYYVIGPAAYTLAREAHDARLQALADIYSELEAIAVAIDQQER